MQRITRLVILIAGMLSSLAMMASAANAVTWHTTGDTAFTAAGGAATFGVTGVNLACASSSVTGTAPAGSKVGNTVDIATLTETRTGCTLSGIPTTWECRMTVTAVTATALTTVHTVNHENCSVTQFGVEICKVEGSTAGTYHNPIAPSTFGRLTVPATTSLRTTNGTGGSCPQGVGEPSSYTTRTYTLSNATGGASAPHLGPVITRTA